MSNPNSPVKVKARARGVTAKVKPAPEIKPLDHAEEALTQIERDLQKHKIGHFRVHDNDMTFEWKEGQNRAIADHRRLSMLLDIMAQGVYRTEPKHRMSGCIDSKVIEKAMFTPDGKKHIKAADVKALNENAEWPVLKLPRNKLVEMQSGQHRMACLKKLHPDDNTSHWWLVTIYDNGNNPLLFWLIMRSI